MTAGGTDAGDELDFYDDAPCGYLTTSADGVVTRANSTLLGWLGIAYDDLVGRDLPGLLRAGGRVIWLTHHVPRLAATGRLDAVSLELVRADGSVLPVLVSAVTAETRDAARPVVRMTLVDASERRAYEQELLAARRTAERAEWRMRALQAVTGACSLATGTDRLAQDVVEALTGDFEVASARLWVPDDEATADEMVRTAWHTAEPVLPDAVGDGVARRVVVPCDHDRVLGVLDLVLPGDWPGTVADLDVLATMAGVVGQAIARVRLHEGLERLALEDSLTGLPNRAWFLDGLSQALARAGRTGEPVSLLFVDLDGFKAVNDTHGHLAGDRVLQTAAERLRVAVRAGDPVARLGGDEFVILCSDADRGVAETVAGRIREAMQEPIDLAGLGSGTARVAASVGVAVAQPPYGAGTAEQLLAAGDAAMYAEKRRARKSVVAGPPRT